MSQISGYRLFEEDMLQATVIDHVFRIQTIQFECGVIW